MNKRCVVIFLSIVTLLPLLLTSAQNVAQDLSAEQKAERCQTNQRRLEELEEEVKKLENDVLWSDERVARARTQLAAVRRIKARARTGQMNSEDYDRLDEVSQDYGYHWDACIIRDSLSICLWMLERELAKKIDAAVAARRRGSQATRRKQELEQQISFHRRRINELGCDEQAESESEQSAQGDSNYMGCFLDNNTRERPRDLSGAEFRADDMTVERCVETCKEKGYAYAATQYGAHCFCGNSYGRYGELTSTSARRCDKPCSGNPNQICGGAWANSVYKTGN